MGACRVDLVRSHVTTEGFLLMGRADQHRARRIAREAGAPELDAAGSALRGPPD